MSALSKQLQQIKNNQRAIKVAPNQQQPTLVLDAHTATTASPDLIYTMSILSYSKLISEQPSLKIEGEVVMGSEYKELNRNTLTKEVNRALSEKLIKFMLKVSPFFLCEDGQKVIEYLLHNFKVNVFEAEALAIIFLQYWNTPIYQKLISNIPEKILLIKLPFLLKLSSQEPHNFTYIVKSLAYSHYLVSSVLLYTLEYLKVEKLGVGSMDIEINLGEEVKVERENLVRCDPRRFLLQIFSEFINRKMNNCFKYILQFCGKAIQTGGEPSAQTFSMIMLLSTRLIIEDAISNELLTSITCKLLKKGSFFKGENALRPIYDFVLIVWQRRPACINEDIVSILNHSQEFETYLSKFKCSLWMVLMRLFELLSEGVQCTELIVSIGSRVKKDEFYILYGKQYLEKLFSLLERPIQLLINQHALPTLEKFFKEHFSYEVAHFYNLKAVKNQAIRTFITNLFEEQVLKISKRQQLVFILNKIPKKSVTASKNIPLMQQTHFSQEESDIEEEIKVEKTTSSLVSLLRNRGFQITSVKFDDQTLRPELIDLGQKYYQKGERIISKEQKNQIFERILSAYQPQMWAADLEANDFITPIKYLSQKSDLKLSQQTLLLLVQDIAIIDDILYKELFRLSLIQITSFLNTSYKQIIYYLNTLFKKLMSKYILENSEPIQIIKLSELLLKISEEIFGRGGVRRGKYHRLLHNHGRLIAELILSLKNKKLVTKGITEDERIILDHYLRVLKTFGNENIYLLNIGIIEILTRKEMDHTHVKYFVTKVLVGSVNQGGFDFHSLSFSLAKTIIFCGQFSPIIKIDESQVEPSLTSGIAKSVIADFFGLIKDKFKRVMVKKLLVFLRSIFQNSYFIQSFKSHLVELNEQGLEHILALYTEFYKILSLIASEDNQIQQFRESIMDKITNIFPLNLRLVLFEPLLPNQHLYTYLASQLEEHSAEKSQFQQLAHLINIVPIEVTFEWVKFVRESLKRGNKPSEALVASIFEKYSSESNVNCYSELICEFAQYCPELLYAHLPLSIEIIEKHCETPNDFTLALVSRLIRNLGEMIDPYLNKLVLTALSFDSAYTEAFIQEVTGHLVPSTLIKLIKENHKKATHFANFSLLFKQIVMKGVGDSLNKTLLNFISRTLISYLESEESPQQIVRLQAEIFLQIGLKMNENQLRKSIIDLVRWSEAKSEIEEGLPFNLRKIVVAQIYSLLEENLLNLFNPFYGYVFEATLKDFQAINKYFENKQKPTKGNELKRPREDNNQSKEALIELYLRTALRSYQQLFNNDADHQFLDSVKIETLGDPFAELILMSQSQRFAPFIAESLSPCLVSLHKCIGDDYQMKTFNYRILLLLKKKNPRIQRAIFELVDRLVDVLQDRFLILVSDLVPFLLEWAGSRHEGISKVVRRIIGKIEQLSGEQIQNYAN